LSKGRPTQGVFKDNIAWLDPYSGPASAFWGTRSLVLFYYVSRTLDWASVSPAPLPSMQQDWVVNVPAAQMVVRTDVRAGTSEVAVCSEHSSGRPDLSLQTWQQRLRQLVYACAVRPNNNLLDMGVCRYSSALDHYQDDR
jgi:hypothetical protein